MGFQCKREEHSSKDIKVQEEGKLKIKNSEYMILEHFL